MVKEQYRETDVIRKMQVYLPVFKEVPNLIRKYPMIRI